MGEKLHSTGRLVVSGVAGLIAGTALSYFVLVERDSGEPANGAPAGQETPGAGAGLLPTTVAVAAGANFQLGPFVCDTAPTAQDAANPLSQFYVNVGPDDHFEGSNLEGHGSIIKAIADERGAFALEIPSAQAIEAARAIATLTTSLQQEACIPANPAVTNPDNFPLDDWLVPTGCKLNGVRYF